MRTQPALCLFLLVPLTACGTVKPPPHTAPDGGGAPDGSSGCQVAADCAAGTACELASHTCVAAAFTIDKTDFFDDGQRWWTVTSGPKLHGTLAAPSGATLQAMIGDHPSGPPATVDGTTWTIQLPAGAITETDTAVVFQLVESAGAELDLSRTFALDDKTPIVNVFGQIHDERGDTIDFSSGDPVHTHAGPTIDLSAGCPDVYKYAYLLDSSAPMYGSEATPNPLAWQFKVQVATKLDDTASAYRVRLDDGTIAQDWTALTPDASGIYAVALHRGSIGVLGTRDGVMYIDARFRDWGGNQTVQTACWHHHPLAAPIEVGPVQAATTANALFTMSFAAGSQISNLMRPVAPFSPYADLATQRFVQHTAEPVTVTLSFPWPTGTYTKLVFDHYFTIASGATLMCGTDASPSSDPRCATAPTPVSTSTPYAGSIGPSSWSVVVIDETLNQAAPCTGTVFWSMSRIGVICNLPSRAAGAPPHAYHAVVSFDDVQELQPWPFGPFSEFTISGHTYTGTAPQTFEQCNRMLSHFNTTTMTTLYTCASWGQYTGYSGLDQATLAFDPLVVTFATGLTDSVTPSPVAYVPAANLTTGPLTWSAGTANLP